MRWREVGLGAVFAIAFGGALTGCHRGGTPAAKPSPPAPTAPAAFQALFTADLLGEEIPYFERAAGPAFRVEDGWRVYKVAGCSLEVQPDGSKITAVRLPADPKCDVDLNALSPGYKFPAISKLTFGGFERVVGTESASFGADCIYSCGNRENVGVYAWYEGAHASDELQFVIEGDQFSDAGRAAIAPWRDSLLKAHGEAWVSNRKYDCTGDQLRVPASLGPLHVTSIAIGRGIRTPDAFCTDGVAAEGDIPATTNTTEVATDEDQDDKLWYFAIFKFDRCVPISILAGATGPKALLDGFARSGHPQIIVGRKPDRMVFRSADDPTQENIAIIRGRANCLYMVGTINLQLGTTPPNS